MAKISNYAILTISFCSMLFSGCQCSSCCTPANQKETISKKIKSPDTADIKKTPDQLSLNRNSKKTEKGGILYITRTDVFYIKDGSIKWQSSPAQRYQKLDNRYYVATGDYVFCAMENGSVLWKITLPNKGSCDIKDGKLYVSTARGEMPVSLNTGTSE